MEIYIHWGNLCVNRNFKCIVTFLFISVQPWRGTEVPVRRGARAAPQGNPVWGRLQQCDRTDCQGRQTLESGSGNILYKNNCQQLSVFLLFSPIFYTH